MSVHHGSFVVERHYPFPPGRVFQAFADPTAKRRWFAEGEGWEVEHHALDFRTGGRETSRFRYRGGPPITNDTVIHDVVHDERIVISYAMTIDGRPLSVSLQTVELFAEPGGTRLRLTEHAAFFDGADGVEGRTAGTEGLLDALGLELARA